MPKHRIRPKPLDLATLWPERNQDHRNTGSPRGQNVRFRVPDQDGTPRVAPCASHGLGKRRRIRLSNRQSIRPHERAEAVANTKPLHQCLGKAFGLVCADPDFHPLEKKCIDGIQSPWIKLRLPTDVLFINIQEIWIITIHIVFAQALVNAREPKPQHRSRPVKRGKLVGLWIKKCPKPTAREARVRRSDQVRACVGKCTIEIENYRFHVTPIGKFAPLL